MKFPDFTLYQKCVLSLFLIICLANTAAAAFNNTNNSDKAGGIALSWDDSGNIESCYEFLQIFEKYNATCTMNVNKLSTHARKIELNALVAAGWEIASHGYNHVNSVQFLGNSTPLAWLGQEIFPNIAEISNYNYPVRTLAYPYSARDLNSDAILDPYFRTLRTDVPQVENGNVSATSLAYYKWDNARLLYGVEIDDRSGVSLQSIEHGIDHAIQTGTVLVLYGHAIAPNVTARYQTSTARLDSILNYTSQKGGVFYHLGDLGNSSWQQLPEFSKVTANYTISSNYLLAGKSVRFTDYSVNKTAEQLDFGDGSPTSSTANITHIYKEPGIYTANLTVSNDVFSDSMLKIIVIVEPVSPFASFTSSSTSGTRPLSIAFIDKSTGFPTSWSWDFGDGDASSIQNPVHEYSHAGNYSVTLTVANEKGSDTIQKPGYITVLPIVAALPQSLLSDFSSNVASEDVPLTVHFKDTSTGSPTSWHWDFGDGYSSIEQNPAHTYSAAGTYKVSLKVSNEDWTSSKTGTIDVQYESSSGSSHSSRSGGGSASAGGSPEPQNNVEIKEITQAFIVNGNPVKFDFPQKATPVTFISFEPKQTAGKTAAIVEMLKGKSTLVSGLPSEETYKFVNIWVGNSGFATPKNIDNSIVSFKVEKSWIDDKKIDRSLITLNRYSNNKWVELPTRLSGEADDFLYFTAQTPGFSYFAITGKTTGTGTIRSAENQTQPVENITHNNTNMGSTVPHTGPTPELTPEQTPEQSQNSHKFGKPNTKLPGFELASDIVCLLCLYLYKKK